MLKLGDLTHVLDLFPVLVSEDEAGSLVRPKLRKVSFQSVPSLEPQTSSPTFFTAPFSKPPPSPPHSHLHELILQTISNTMISRFDRPITKLEFLKCFSVFARFIEGAKRRVPREVTEVFEMDMGEIERETRDSETRVDDD